MIKVSDFGLTEDMYSSNYYRHDSSQTGSEEKVPIKWMAPESIETNRFDETTDVVSFILFLINGNCERFWRFIDTWFVYAVVIWSDMLGGVHMWRGALCWCPSHHSSERASLWTQTGQTQQPILL